MQKGKLGITLKTYATIAFVMALFGQMLLCGLLLGFVLVNEKDEWLSRQCMQAFFLTFAISVIGLVGLGLGLLGSVFNAIGGVGGAIIMVLFMILPGIAAICVVVFEIVGIFRVSKGQEADIPIVSALTYSAFGQSKPKPMAYGQPYTDPYAGGNTGYNPNMGNNPGTFGGQLGMMGTQVPNPPVAGAEQHYPANQGYATPYPNTPEQGGFGNPYAGAESPVVPPTSYVDEGTAATNTPPASPITPPADGQENQR